MAHVPKDGPQLKNKDETVFSSFKKTEDTTYRSKATCYQSTRKQESGGFHWRVYLHCIRNKWPLNLMKHVKPQGNASAALALTNLWLCRREDRLEATKVKVKTTRRIHFQTSRENHAISGPVFLLRRSPGSPQTCMLARRARCPAFAKSLLNESNASMVRSNTTAVFTVRALSFLLAKRWESYINVQIYVTFQMQFYLGIKQNGNDDWSLT